MLTKACWRLLVNGEDGLQQRGSAAEFACYGGGVEIEAMMLTATEVRVSKEQMEWLLGWFGKK